MSIAHNNWRATWRSATKGPPHFRLKPAPLRRSVMGNRGVDCGSEFGWFEAPFDLWKEKPAQFPKHGILVDASKGRGIATAKRARIVIRARKEGAQRCRKLVGEHGS